MSCENSRGVEGRFLQRAVPVGMIDVDRAHVDAVILGVPHELCRLVEPHRLGIEHRRAEDVGIEGLEPAGGIDEQREGSGVTLGKAVFAETLDLLEAAFGKLLRIALGDHAGDHPVAVLMNGSVAPERRHGAAQPVGLAGGKPANVDGDLHRLLLEQGHAERASQDRSQFRVMILLLLQSLASAQIGMDHVALDRSGPDDGHFDHQIVETARLEPRQH